MLVRCCIVAQFMQLINIGERVSKASSWDPIISATQENQHAVKYPGLKLLTSSKINLYIPTDMEHYVSFWQTIFFFLWGLIMKSMCFNEGFSAI